MYRDELSINVLEFDGETVPFLYLLLKKKKQKKNGLIWSYSGPMYLCQPKSLREKKKKYTAIGLWKRGV